MKKRFLSIMLCLVMVLGMLPVTALADDGDVPIDETNFPDANFRTFVSSKYDTNSDGILSASEIGKVGEINCSSQKISSLQGIEYFTWLHTLRCYYNPLTSLDVSKNTNLKFLSCYSCGMENLNISGNTLLKELYCYSNKLTSLDVSNNTALTSLECYSNNLTGLDVSSNLALTGLKCYSNPLMRLDVSKNTALMSLYCHGNKLTSLDVSNNKSLTILSCASNNLTSIDISNNLALEQFFCDDNQLTKLDISKNKALKLFQCGDNKLTSLDVSNNKSLITLFCGNNQLTSLDVSNNRSLNDLKCSQNQLTSLDVSKNTGLRELLCYDNPLTSLDLSTNRMLKKLYCSNNQLTSLDVSKNTYLENFYCYDNQLTSLDVSNNKSLKVLQCYNNNLTSLDVSKNTALTSFKCDGNQAEIYVDEYRTFDLSTLPGSFDASKASQWAGGTVTGSILTVDAGAETVTYNYDTGNGTNPTWGFTLKIKEGTHVHSYVNWKWNDKEHWRECVCGAGDTKTAHSGTDDGNCTTAVVCECGRILTAAQNHDFTGAYDKYDADGHWHICNHTGCTGTDTKQNHSFTSYSYNNDATYFADGTETAICDAAGCSQRHTRSAVGTKLVDITAPTGAITVGKNIWTSFASTVSFGIFSKDQYDVTITAADPETGVASIEYLLSDTAISETDIAKQTGWKTYSAFSLTDEGKYIIYVKITDKAGNVAYLSSNGLVIDRTAPAIGGLVNGKTYCETITFTVDDDNIDYVTVNGDKVTDYTLAADGTTYTVKAYDKAGNESLTYTVTVNNGHSWDEPTYQWSEDGKACTAKRVCKNDANHTETATATITSKVTKDETCTEAGETTYTAAFTESWAAEQTKVIADVTAPGHSWGEPTYQWSEDGKACTAKRVCKNDANHIETATATVTSKVTKDETCTEAGETTYTAAFTKNWAAEQTKVIADITASGHSWGEPTYQWSEDGKACTAKRVCKNDANHTETATATVTSKVTKDETCTEAGETTYTAAFTENWAAEQTKVIVDITASGHSWKETTYQWSEDGKACTAKRVCKNDPNHTETAAATVTSKVTKDETCTEAGETTYTAAFTESWAAEQTKVIADVTASGHSWDEPTYQWSEDGKACTAKRVCKNDPNHTETAAATVTSKVTKPSTCTEAGETTYTAAFTENWAAEQTKVIADVTASGHSWKETTYQWSEDGKACIAKRVCKNDANHTETATATVTSKVTKAETCTEAGETTYTAAFTESWAAEQTKVIADITANGHTPVTDKAVAPTCTQTGLTEGEHCSVCGETLKAQTVVKANGHSYKDTVTAPTCAERGYTVHTCSVCGDTYSDTYVPATGNHTYSSDMDKFCDVCGHYRRIVTVQMYRLYNPNSGEHFYTGSTEERDNLVDVGWNYEGIAWNAPKYIGDPVYRLYNPNSGVHFYTMTLEEVDTLKTEGWQYEGVAWNSAPEGCEGRVPQYRLFDPNEKTGAHHYTGSTEERDHLIDLGWKLEGIGWYGLLH